MRRLLILLLCALAPAAAEAQLRKHNKILKLMGSRFEITAIHSDAQVAWDAINAGIAEITRIEKLISSWNPDSQTSEINRNAGIRQVKVDRELYRFSQEGRFAYLNLPTGHLTSLMPQWTRYGNLMGQ